MGQETVNISMYELKLHPHKAVAGMKYKVIQLTDIQLHSAYKRATASLGKKMRQAFETKTAGRIYNSLSKPLTTKEDYSFIMQVLQFDPDFVKMIQEEEAKGYKVLIALPKEGIPVFLGKDTLKFLDSKNGKRFLRGIDKKKNGNKM